MSTWVIPGAAASPARSADSRSRHERTVPVNVTEFPDTQDVDAPLVDIRILMQRADDSRLNVLGRGCGRGPRRDGDAVGDPFDAFDVAERLLGVDTPVQCVDRSGQRHVTVMDDGL